MPYFETLTAAVLDTSGLTSQELTRSLPARSPVTDPACWCVHPGLSDPVSNVDRSRQIGGSHVEPDGAAHQRHAEPRRRPGHGVDMTDRAARNEVLRQSVFFRTVVDLADRHQLQCSVRLTRRVADRPNAYTELFRRRIVVTRALLDESDDGQAWSAAHEVGHLVDARDRGLWRNVAWGCIGWWVIGGVAFAGGPYLAITALTPIVPETVAVRVVVVVAVAVVAVAVLAGCWHMALLRLAVHQRPLEDAADAFAKSQGYPVTHGIAEMVHRHEQRPDGRPQSRFERRSRLHRDPFDRINENT